MRGKQRAKSEPTTLNKKRSYLKQDKTTAAQRSAIENNFSDTPLSKADFKRKLTHNKKAA